MTVRGRVALALAATFCAGPLAAQAPVAPSAAAAPASSAPAMSRFDIVTVGDSTLTLRVGQTAWMRRGRRGIVVDPRRNDALVARFRVLAVGGDTAVALLTGLTSPVARQHVALVETPRTRWYQAPHFWKGALLGVAVGAAAGAAAVAAF